MKKSEYIKCDYYNNNSYRFKYNSYYRNVSTFNERKQNAWALQDGYKVRGARTKLPDYWDDIRYSFIYKKCWKRFTRRKHQYKGQDAKRHGG